MAEVIPIVDANAVRSDDASGVNNRSAFSNKSNNHILQVTSALFFIFVIAEVLGALVGSFLKLLLIDGRPHVHGSNPHLYL
jgi:hypothetical protein